MANQNPTPSEIIDALGGPTVVAAMCDISPSAVTQWRTNGIPKSSLKFLRLAAPAKFAELEAKPPSEDKRKTSRRSGKERRVVPTRRTKDLAK